MSIGGSSNLGTLLLRRLDTALSVQASQQSQIVSATRSDAIAQLADAARISPIHNEGGRPLPETIEKAQAQIERQARQPVESGKLQPHQPGLRHSRPVTDTSYTPSAPTSLGQAAKTILTLLSLFPGQAPALSGRSPLIPSSPATASASTPGATPAAASTGGTQGGAPAGPGSATAMAASASANAPEGQPAQIMRALSMALQQSGAFYESHLHGLVFKERSAAQLQQEPQGQLARSAGSPSPQAGAASQDSAAASSRGAGPAVESAPAEGRGTTTAAAQGSATSSQTLAGLHPDTQPIVRQQLEILAGQVFSWRGEAWPDTPMDWEVARQDEEGLPDETGTHWATTLRLHLPSLGQVEARLSLHDQQVVMRLVAPQSAQTLAQNDQALRAGFQDAGLTLSQLTILQEEQT